VRRFAKPLSGVTCSEGSNPSLSASAPVAQWIERQVADLKAVSSSLAGRAILSVPLHGFEPEVDEAEEDFPEVPLGRTWRHSPACTSTQAQKGVGIHFKGRSGST
jgi:hypothetical protein